MNEKRKKLILLGTQIDGVECYIRQLREMEKNRYGAKLLKRAETHLTKIRELMQAYEDAQTILDDNEEHAL